LLGVTFLMTRYLTFFNLHYTLPAMPLLLLMAFGALGELVQWRAAHIAFLYTLGVLFTATTFRTIDPISKTLRSTFAFGKHPMLNIRERAERRYFGRDKVVYNLEVTEFHRLQNIVYRSLQPNAQHAMLMPHDL